MEREKFKKTLFSAGYLYSGSWRISNVIRPAISNPVPGDETSVIGKRHETGHVTDWRAQEGSKEKAISSFHYSQTLFPRSFLIQSRGVSWLNTRSSDQESKYSSFSYFYSKRWRINSSSSKIKLNHCCLLNSVWRLIAFKVLLSGYYSVCLDRLLCVYNVAVYKCARTV